MYHAEDEVSMDDRIEGKIALVTGGSRGIGKAIARALARDGMRIALHYCSREKEAQAVCDEIVGTGGICTIFQADVSDSTQIRKLVRDVEWEFDRIDILINNAGITRPQNLGEITEKDWDELIAVNLKSVFLISQLVIPGMRERKWGRIVYMSSVAAQTGGVVGPHYAASKAGILGLTHSYANLLARDGITVNAIAPALIETEMVAANPRAKPDLIPIGRFGTCEEAADVALMLVKNGYMTGQTINVNGGMYFA